MATITLRGDNVTVRLDVSVTLDMGIDMFFNDIKSAVKLYIKGRTLESIYFWEEETKDIPAL